eukprot:jgi/Hompol1/7015/HPOL_005159-RA
MEPSPAARQQQSRHSTKSNVHVPKTSNKPPNSAEEVSAAMREMDRRHGTSFESWIKNEKNIGYLCTFKRSLFEEFSKKDPQRLIHALNWITSDWSTASTAELILKLFYHLRIDSPEFCRILAGVTQHWSLEDLCSLLHILLIGESCHVVVAFIRFFTDQDGACQRLSGMEISIDKVWSTTERVALFRDLASGLIWKDEFLQSFLIDYTRTCVEDPVKQRGLMLTIYRDFEDRQALLSLNRFSRRVARLGRRMDETSNTINAAELDSADTTLTELDNEQKYSIDTDTNGLRRLSIETRRLDEFDSDEDSLYQSSVDEGDQFDADDDDALDSIDRVDQIIYEIVHSEDSGHHSNIVAAEEDLASISIGETPGLIEIPGERVESVSNATEQLNITPRVHGQSSSVASVEQDRQQSHDSSRHSSNHSETDSNEHLASISSHTHSQSQSTSHYKRSATSTTQRHGDYMDRVEMATSLFELIQTEIELLNLQKRLQQHAHDDSLFESVIESLMKRIDSKMDI